MLFNDFVDVCVCNLIKKKKKLLSLQYLTKKNLGIALNRAGKKMGETGDNMVK